jgi:hypothetical protein
MYASLRRTHFCLKIVFGYSLHGLQTTVYVLLFWIFRTSKINDCGTAWRDPTADPRLIACEDYTCRRQNASPPEICGILDRWTSAGAWHATDNNDNHMIGARRRHSRSIYFIVIRVLHVTRSRWSVRYARGTAAGAITGGGGSTRTRAPSYPTLE